MLICPTCADGIHPDISLVTKALNIEPTKMWSAGDKRKNGSIHEVSLWEHHFSLPERFNKVLKTI